MEDGAQLEAMWEFAHVMDVVFHPQRSPYLDIAPARVLLEQILSRISDEDPRIPGVLGLPEVSRWMVQIDRDRALEVLNRWLTAAERSGDGDGMTTAALALYGTDPERGTAALNKVRDGLLQRVDCLSMGEFARQVADTAPEVVLTLAPSIPDRRERAEALATSAAALYSRDPERSLSLIRGLELPSDRSNALMTLVDRLLGTGDRPRPQPLLEDMP
jgi:hypothetical protein